MPGSSRRRWYGRPIASCAVAGRQIALVPDGDADGLSAGLIAFRGLERLGCPAPAVIHPGKGEHLHSPTVRERLRDLRPDAVVALDNGSRGEEVVPGLPLLVLDHHRPRGFPPGSVVVNAADLDPVPSSSIVAFAVFSGLVDLADIAWLATLGAVGDLGADGDFPGLRERVRTHGATALRKAVPLLNAPRRSGAHDVQAAWDVLARAKGARDISAGLVRGAARLEEYRAEVAREIERCARQPPRVGARFALVLVQSPAKVHPVLAARWARRLRDRIVVVANLGYLPDRINFALRSARGEDLLVALHGLGVPLAGDAGYGHPQATGGSLPPGEFARLVAAMGFDPRALAPLAEGAHPGR